MRTRWIIQGLFLKPFYRAWALHHIRRARTIRLHGLRLEAPAGVFHPGIFFSTAIFLRFLDQQNFSGKCILDVGSGSGALAVFCAKKGAIAHALDIHPAAVAATMKNAALNGVEVIAVESDLFDQLPAYPYDYMVINPPFYAETPRDMESFAFFAGDQLQYFERLFGAAARYLSPGAGIFMILSEDCPLQSIIDLAMRNEFQYRIVMSATRWGEIFQIFHFFREETSRPI